MAADTTSENEAMRGHRQLLLLLRDRMGGLGPRTVPRRMSRGSHGRRYPFDTDEAGCQQQRGGSCTRRLVKVFLTRRGIGAWGVPSAFLYRVPEGRMDSCVTACRLGS